MHRTTLCILAALLVAFPATAAAQDANETQAKTTDEPTFRIHVEPRVQHAKPGDVVAFRVKVESKVEQRISLSASEGRLAESDLYVPAYGANGTALKLVVPNGTAPRLVLVVKALSPSGEAHAAEAVIEMKRPDARPPPPPGLCVAAYAKAPREANGTTDEKPRPAVEKCVKPMPKPQETRPLPIKEKEGGDAYRLYAMLLQRILRLEAALRAAGIQVDAEGNVEAPAPTP